MKRDTSIRTVYFPYRDKPAQAYPVWQQRRAMMIVRALGRGDLVLLEEPEDE